MLIKNLMLWNTSNLRRDGVKLFFGLNIIPTLDWCFNWFVQAYWREVIHNSRVQSVFKDAHCPFFVNTSCFQTSSKIDACKVPYMHVMCMLDCCFLVITWHTIRHVCVQGTRYIEMALFPSQNRKVDLLSTFPTILRHKKLRTPFRTQRRVVHIASRKREQFSCAVSSTNGH